MFNTEDFKILVLLNFNSRIEKITGSAQEKTVWLTSGECVVFKKHKHGWWDVGFTSDKTARKDFPQLFEIYQQIYLLRRNSMYGKVIFFLSFFTVVTAAAIMSQPGCL